MMSSLLSNIRKQTADLPAQHLANLDEVEAIRIESGALSGVAGFLEQKGWTSAVLVADRNTYEKAGKSLEELLVRASLQVQVTLLRPDAKDDVIADEASLIQVILDIQQSRAGAVLAVGGGTIHDISRYAAYTAGLPFVSVPTAASVDGFTSKGAPIIVRGKKGRSPPSDQARFLPMSTFSCRPPHRSPLPGSGICWGNTPRSSTGDSAA